MIRWLLCAVALIICKAFVWPLAFLAVWKREMRDGPILNNSATGIEPRPPLWLKWIDTDDNSLWGDGGWRTEHHPSDYQTFMGMVKWLWRNGGHHFNYHVIGCPWIEMKQVAGVWYWRRPDGYWLYRRFIPIGGRTLELFFGWNLFGNVGGRCKIACQVRFPKRSE